MGRTKDSHRAAQPHPRLSLGPYKQSPVKEKARKEQQAPVTKAKATLKENRAPAPKRVLVEKKEETRSSKAAKVEESSAKGLFRYRLCLASDKDLVKVTPHLRPSASSSLPDSAAQQGRRLRGRRGAHRGGLLAAVRRVQP